MVTVRLRGGRGSGPLSQAVHFVAVPVIQDVSKGDSPGGASDGFFSRSCRWVEAGEDRVFEGRVFQVGQLVLRVGRGGCRLFRVAPPLKSIFEAMLPPLPYWAVHHGYAHNWEDGVPCINS